MTNERTESSRKQRDDLLREIPWITEIKEVVNCDGIVWKRVRMKKFHAGLSINEEAKCKLKARWKFRKHKDSMARSGNYCLHHLMSCGLYSDLAEEGYTNDWLNNRVGGDGSGKN